MKKIICLTLIFSMLFIGNTVNAKAVTNEKEIYESITQKFLSSEIPIVNSVGGEWMIIGLSRAEKISDSFVDGYIRNVEKLLKENGSAKLHRAKSTENSRVILALTSIQKNATNIDGYNLLEPLSDFSFVKKQGVNGAAWALTAFNCGNFIIPTAENEENQTTRKRIVDYILENQLADGGWTLSGDTSDIDITAMVIQSLSPYYDKNYEVKTAIDNALNYLKTVRNIQSCESAAQIIIALSSVGINPKTDKSFDSILEFSVGDGFSHTLNLEYNQMSTEQGYLALTAYLRLTEGKTALYDMSDLANNTLNSYDINFDSATDINDCTYIQRFLSGYFEFSYLQKEYADIDGTLIVDINDVTQLQRYIAKV